MKKFIYFLLLSATLGLGSCASVGVNSSSRSADAQETISKVFIVSNSKGRAELYYTRLVHQLGIMLQAKGIQTEVFIITPNNQAVFDELLAAYVPCHTLSISESGNEFKHDELTITEKTKLDVVLQKAGDNKILWRSEIGVSSGGAWGLGSIETGVGGKLTAQKIITTMEAEGIVPKEALVKK